MNKNITWKELKALDDIYRFKRTKAVIQDHPYINYLLHELCVLDRKPDNIKVVIATEMFEEFYEKEFKTAYEEAKSFLIENGIEIDARKSFTLEDVKVLMMIAENRTEIRDNPTNIEDFSNELFDNSKYLKFNKSVRDAIFKILGITEFSLDKKENNWRFVVDHVNPKAIVICENKSFLKQPWIARRAEVKLWYFGGNNIGIVDDIDQDDLSKPLFYCCDWDLEGLKIYLRIKSKLRERGKELHLLYPNEPQKKISTYIDYHNSHWDLSLKLSGLPVESFKKRELRLINNLIQKEQWIEEESFDLLGMLINLTLSDLDMG